MKLQITITDDPVLIRNKTISFTINDSKPIRIGSLLELMYCEYKEGSVIYRTRLIAEVSDIEIHSPCLGGEFINMEGVVQGIIKHESYEPELQQDRVLEEVGNYINFYENEIIRILDENLEEYLNK